MHVLESLDSVGRELVTYTVKPEFRSLGRRFGSRTQAVAAVIRAADASMLAHAAAADGGTVTVPVPQLGEVTLSAADLVVTQTPLSGWEVASGGGETIALDLEVSPSLRAEGHAREVIRLIQDARKSSGLSVSDRIVVRWASPDAEVAAATAAHGATIADEVLAVSFAAGSGPDEASVAGPWHEHGDADLGLRFWLAVAA